MEKVAGAAANAISTAWKPYVATVPYKTRIWLSSLFGFEAASGFKLPQLSSLHGFAYLLLLCNLIPAVWLLQENQLDIGLLQPWWN